MRIIGFGTRLRGRLGRTSAVALCATAALGLAACGDSKDSGGSSSGGAGKAKGSTVGVLLPQNFPYLAPYQTALKREASVKGLKLRILNAQGDAQTQTSQLNQLVSEGVDGLIVWPFDQKAIVPALAQASQRKIPIMVSNGAVDAAGESYYAAYRGPNDVKAGESAGAAITKALNGKGRILLIEGQPGQAPTNGRKEGLLKYLKANAPGIQILAQQPANWDQPTAMSVTRTLLTKYGKDVDGIVAQDDTMAAGAVQAVQGVQDAKARKVPVIGNGGSKAGLKNIKQGLQSATVLVSPTWDGNAAADTIAELLEGKQVAKTGYMPTPIVTADNVEKYLPGLW